MQIVLGLPAIKRIVAVFLSFCRALTSWSRAKGVLRDREFQFGAKLWFCCATVLVGIIILQQDYPAARRWSPYYGYITIPIIFNARVCIPPPPPRQHPPP